MFKITSEKKIIPKYPLTKKEKELLELVDKNKDKLIELLRKLVQIESVNYSAEKFNERSKIFEFTSNFLKQENIQTKLYKAPFSENEKNKFYYNQISILAGTKPGKTLQFNGHLDIVPFNEERWDEDTPPLGGVIKDNKIYGRGAFDMKAGVAAQMMVMKLLKDSEIDFSGKLQLWLTPDEETHGTYGSKYMAKNHFEIINADATIIGEASVFSPLESPAIVMGEKGPHWLRFTFHGVSGHGSRPKKKSNALKKAVNFIAQADKKLKITKYNAPITKIQFLRSIYERLGLANFIKFLFEKTEKHPLDRDKRGIGVLFNTTFSFNQFHAGVKTNVIPDEAEIEVDFRLLPGLSTQQLFSNIAKYCSKLGYKLSLPEGYTNPQDQKHKFKEKPIDVTLSVITKAEGSISDINSNFSRVLQNAFESLYKVRNIFGFYSGFTDGGNIRDAGLQNIFIIGPDGKNAHNANEYVKIDSLVSITKLYLLTAYRYLTNKNKGENKKET